MNTLFTDDSTAFSREFCHGTTGGLFGAALREIPIPNDFNAGSPNAAKRAACADSPSAEPASISATPPAAIAQDAQQGLAGGLSLTEAA